MDETLENLIIQYNEKRLSLAGLEKEIKANIKDKNFFESAIDRQPFLDSLSLPQALLEFEAKSITVDELAAVVAKAPNAESFWLTGSQRNINYPEGNNESHAGFTWNCVHHIKGKFFQNVAKRIILKTIETVHSQMVKNYDKELYVYDDNRLIALDTFFRFYFNKNFEKDANYKHIFMGKLLDIVLSLQKEDIYYRSRMFDMIRLFVKTYPEGFPLTPDEKANIEHWH